MDLYGQKSKSIPQKVVIHLIEIMLLWLSYWILFRSGGAWFEKHLHIRNATENIDRRIMIFTFNILIFFRLAFMMIVLLKRKIPWEESVSVPFAFALYFIGYSLLVLPISAPVDRLDYFAIALFVMGCTLNSGSEIQRYEWKNKLENSGKIYTKGFFKYSRHINYFGDILWVIAFDIVTKNWYSITIPIFWFAFSLSITLPNLNI